MIMSQCNTSENVPKILQCLYSLIYESGDVISTSHLEADQHNDSICNASTSSFLHKDH